MINVISNYYASLVETLKHMESLKLKDRPWDNITDFCDTILVDSEWLESSGAFKPELLIYIIIIFKDTYDYRFHIWVTQNYKDFMEFIKKLFVCNKYFMQTDEIFTYGSLVKETMREYRTIVDSKMWETTDSKKKSQDKPLILKAYNVEIEDPFNNTV